jgi:short-subunit dehydrogenase
MRDPRSILITGASSGIGAALARRYAAPGIVLALTGRDAARLAAVAADCQSRGARALTAAIDVVDAAALAAWMAEIDRAHPLDLVIANAGISGGSAGTAGKGERPEQAARILAVNVEGVRHTVEPALALMAARGRGQIALMSSLAGFRGFPGAPAYCASKAWVRVWGEALRPDFARRGVGVSVICPGYVRSPMTDRNDFPMPFLIDAERAAEIVARGLARGRARIVFPWRLYAILRVVAALPEPLLDRLLARLPRKADL